MLWSACCYWGKIPDKCNLNEDVFILAQGLGAFSPRQLAPRQKHHDRGAQQSKVVLLELLAAAGRQERTRQEGTRDQAQSTGSHLHGPPRHSHFANLRTSQANRVDNQESPSQEICSKSSHVHSTFIICSRRVFTSERKEMGEHIGTLLMFC